MIKWLQRYKIYIIVIFCGLILFLYAELPIIKYFQSISFILTNKVLNDFLIALGTGMIGSSLTALLIDRSHEKQNAVISNMMKRQILYDMLLNLRYWINSDDPIEIFEKRHDNEYIDERITECQRSLNFAIPFLSSDEYQAISTILVMICKNYMKKNIIYITKIYMKFYFIIILFWTTHFIVINMKIDLLNSTTLPQKSHMKYVCPLLFIT